MRVAVIGLRGVPNVIGGIETHCANLYPELSRLPGSPQFSLVTRKRYQQSNLVFDERIGIVRLPSPPFAGLETAAHTLLSILYARFVLRADAVSLHGIGPGFFAPLACAMGMKAMVTHHSQDYLRPKWGMLARAALKLGELVSYKFSNGMVCVSKTIKASLEQKFGPVSHGVTVIPNGVPPWPDNDAPADAFLAELGLTQNGYVLAVGRLDETKAFHELVKAFMSRRTGSHGQKLVIVGNGPPKDPYVAGLLSQANNAVLFVGYRQGWELRSLYRGCALFAHPSHMEGYGIVVAEALQARRPIIVSDIPAHREFLLPDASYFRPGDVSAITRALDSGDYAALAASEENRSQVLSSWTSIAQKHLDFMVSCGLVQLTAQQDEVPASGVVRSLGREYGAPRIGDQKTHGLRQ